jgi:hypothetical protein
MTDNHARGAAAAAEAALWEAFHAALAAYCGAAPANDTRPPPAGWAKLENRR